MLPIDETTHKGGPAEMPNFKFSVGDKVYIDWHTPMTHGVVERRWHHKDTGENMYEVRTGPKSHWNLLEQYLMPRK